MKTKIKYTDAPIKAKVIKDFLPKPNDLNLKMNICVLFLTCANEEEAGKIASALLEKKLIVCAKWHPVSSSFLWEGKIDKAEEVLLIMDSIEENFEKIKKEISKLHNYKTFVLLSTRINKTTEEVKKWVKKELK